VLSASRIFSAGGAPAVIRYFRQPFCSELLQRYTVSLSLPSEETSENSAIYHGGPTRPLGTEFDNRSGAMGVHVVGRHREFCLEPAPDEPDEHERDSDEAPETPLDEPRPPRVQDPPPQPGDKGPYVVRAEGW